MTAFLPVPDAPPLPHLLGLLISWASPPPPSEISHTASPTPPNRPLLHPPFLPPPCPSRRLPCYSPDPCGSLVPVLGGGSLIRSSGRRGQVSHSPASLPDIGYSLQSDGEGGGPIGTLWEARALSTECEW